MREMLSLILKENSFQFNGKLYLQTHRTAMGTKTAVSSANIFMSYSETQSLNQTVTFFEEANSHHPTIKFTTKIQISYKTNRYFAIFLKNHPLFPTRKENHGKEHAC